MMFSVLLMSLLLSPSEAQIGKVLKVKGKDGRISRAKSKISMNEDMSLQAGDTASSKASSNLLYLFSDTQVYLYPQSEIKISAKDIWLKKGAVRIKKMNLNNEGKELLVSANKISFTTQAAEFETSTSKEAISLYVKAGEVEASSPLVMTFVPEIIKAGEGFRFTPHERKFERVKYSWKNRDLEFLKAEELKGKN